MVWWCDPFDGMEGSTIGQVRHGSATTTHAVRAAIQRSQASLSQLNRRCQTAAGRFPTGKPGFSPAYLPEGTTRYRSGISTGAEEMIPADVGLKPGLRAVSPVPRRDIVNRALMALHLME
jgi:hypothetical protein